MTARAALEAFAAMDFDAFIAAAWNDHADAADSVAARLPTALARVEDETQVVRLAEFAAHLYGDHLADAAGGRVFLERLTTVDGFAPNGISGQAVRRCAASLALSAGDADAGWAAAMSASDRIRVDAMAAAHLAGRDPARAAALLQRAVAGANSADLAAADPAHRALAVAANNLACTLEEQAARSTDERALMILAARTARTHWAVAGSWLETERAEYRLAMTWLQAGDPAQARVHARACLDIVDAHGGVALERFFACEALARVAGAQGDRAGRLGAVEQAGAAFNRLDDDDKAWCRAELDKLAAF